MEIKFEGEIYVWGMCKGHNKYNEMYNLQVLKEGIFARLPWLQWLQA